jgi:hypothetical protein
VELQESDFKEAKKVEDVREHLEPLTMISTERDLPLKIMDLINPNIPDNGKRDLAENQKLWVVDWKFEQKELKKLGEAADPFGMAAAAGPATGKPFPTSWVLTAVLEVVITKRNSDPEGFDFIVRQLLNYNRGAKRPAREESPCVIKNAYWELPEGTWQVSRDADDLIWPVPKDAPWARGEDLPQSEKKKYWRYQVKLELPVGEENRKTQPAADKGSGKK